MAQKTSIDTWGNRLILIDISNNIHCVPGWIFPFISIFSPCSYRPAAHHFCLLESTKNLCTKIRKWVFRGAFILGFLAAVPLMAESETRVNLQLYNTVYRDTGTTWFYGAAGLVDIRFASTGNKNMKAQAALEFFPQDLSSSENSPSPSVSLKRLWIKASFPSWRLTAGKTKVAWGNGFVYNSGDILFGSLSPYLDFTQSAVRDDTAFLTAINIPLGRFSYMEAVVLPPDMVYNSDTGSYALQSIDHTSAGMRFFFRIDDIHYEGGYIYKGDKKVANDFLGHRSYLSFHALAGVDIYGAVSLAAGYDSSLPGDQYRDSWDEISKTVNISLGAVHQIRAGYDGTLSFRLESLILPWQHWEPLGLTDILAGAGYGIMIYPEISWNFLPPWTITLQSVISPIDESAQIISSVGWHVFQGFTLLGYVSLNIGGEQSLFAWDRAEVTEWPEQNFNGMSFTLGGRYSY